MATGTDTTDIAIIGAGNIGIAVAYYLVIRHGLTRVVLLEPGDPMAMTSASPARTTAIGGRTRP